MKIKFLHSVSALCLLWPAGILYAQSTSPGLGTLFTTPEEREYLDYLREDFLARNQANDFNINEEVPPIIPINDDIEPESGITEFEIGGFFSRSNGNHTAWINGVAVSEEALPDNMAFVNSADTLFLRIETESQSFLLRPGQTLNTINEEVTESYNFSFSETQPVVEDGNEQNSSAEPGTDATQAALSEPAAENVTGSLSPDEIDALINEASPEEIAALLEAMQALQDARDAQ